MKWLLVASFLGAATTPFTWQKIVKMDWGASGVQRFFDPDYGVVCYTTGSTGEFSCVSVNKCQAEKQ